jgi:hypothetical protein
VIWRSALVACLICASHTLAGPAKRDFTFTTVHEFEAREGLVVDVYNPTGPIAVRPSSTSAIQIIEKIVIPASDSSYAATFLDEAVITLSQSDQRVSMTALVRRPPHLRAVFGGLLDLRMQTRAIVHFEVCVPSGLHLVAGTTAASIHAEFVNARLELTSTSGRLDLEASANDVAMTTTSGAIDISGCKGTLTVNTADGHVSVAQSGGTLSVTSQSGAISVGNWTGDARLETSAGSIETTRTAGALLCRSRSGRCVIESHQGALKLNSSSGPVTLLGFPGGEELNIVTVSGDIDVQLGTVVPRRLDARSRRGTVTSSLDSMWNQKGSRQLKGDWEGGSGVLYLETTEGQIRLSRGI